MRNKFSPQFLMSTAETQHLLDLDQLLALEVIDIGRAVEEMNDEEKRRIYGQLHAKTIVAMDFVRLNGPGFREQLAKGLPTVTRSSEIDPQALVNALGGELVATKMQAVFDQVKDSQ